MHMQFIIVSISTRWVGSRKQKSATEIKSTNLHPTGYHQVCKWINIYKDDVRLQSKLRKGGNEGFCIIIPKYDSIPHHYVVILRGATYASRRVLHQPLEIPHQPLPRRGRHPRMSLHDTYTSPWAKGSHESITDPPPPRPSTCRTNNPNKIWGEATAVTTSTQSEEIRNRIGGSGHPSSARTIRINKSHTERILQSFTSVRRNQSRSSRWTGRMDLQSTLAVAYAPRPVECGREDDDDDERRRRAGKSPGTRDSFDEGDEF